MYKLHLTFLCYFPICIIFFINNYILFTVVHFILLPFTYAEILHFVIIFINHAQNLKLFGIGLASENLLLIAGRLYTQKSGHMYT